MTKKYPSIQVINRAASLLDAITRDELPVSLKVLAAQTGLHPATAFRILGALAGNGLTERDDRGRYRIGSQLSAINARASLDVKFRRAAQMAMDQTQDATSCSVALGTRDRDLLIPLQSTDQHQEPATADVPQHYLQARLLHHTGCGRLILGSAGRRNYERYIRRVRSHLDAPQISSQNPNQGRGQDPSGHDLFSAAGVNALWQKIVAEDEHGYAIEQTPVEPDVRTLSVIVNPDETWRSLTISLRHHNSPNNLYDEAKLLSHLNKLARHIAYLDDPEQVPIADQPSAHAGESRPAAIAHAEAETATNRAIN